VKLASFETLDKEAEERKKEEERLKMIHQEEDRKLAEQIQQYENHSHSHSYGHHSSTIQQAYLESMGHLNPSTSSRNNKQVKVKDKKKQEK